MNTVRKSILLTLVALLPFAAGAQKSNIPQRNEIVQANGYEVFNSPKDGQNRYYLSVGHLGIGDAVVQVNFDPAFELFIPLGNSLSEAIATLEGLKAQCKQPRRTQTHTLGCLAFGFPKEELETVDVITRRTLLQRQLEFSISREGYRRAAYVTKSEIGSLLSGVKLYHRIHPKEN